MDELDPAAREVLSRYQDETRMSAPMRERVWRRLDTSLDAEQATPPRGQRPVQTLVLLASLAAALLVAVCDLGGRLGDAARPHDEAAPYTAPPAPAEYAQRRGPGLPPPPVREATAPAGIPKTPARRRVTPGPSALAAELALLRRARDAIDLHDPEAALQRLAEYARDFPDGQMRQDHSLMRVEALCARGDTPQARAEARAFLHQYPGSPHTTRIQTICSDLPNLVTDPGPGGESPHHD